MQVGAPNEYFLLSFARKIKKKDRRKKQLGNNLINIKLSIFFCFDFGFHFGFDCSDFFLFKVWVLLVIFGFSVIII